MSILLENLRLKESIYLLSHSFLSLQGPDVESYLNSQMTNDVLALKEGQFQQNALLEISGKIISSFLLLKESKESFYIICPDNILDITLNRIEKYHISEDFEVEKKELKSFLALNSDKKGYLGHYFFEKDKILLDYDGDFKSQDEDFRSLKCLTGVTQLGEEASPGVLINNTIFNELSVDYKKGCFPGQETVSKINTRRGAAFYPVMLKSKIKPSIDKIIKEEKKIGEILNFSKINDHYFSYAVINRENRVENISITDDSKITYELFYYPYLKPDPKSLAIDLYDYGMECFYKEDNDQAIKYFLKAIEIDTQFEDAYESLGVLYGRLDNFEKAIEVMEKLKGLNPKCMMAYTNLSLYHMKLGNIDVAEDFKSQATLLNFELLGDEAERKRQAKEIEDKKLAERERRESMFNQVLELDAEDAMANNGLGEIELEKLNFESAVKHFEQAILTDVKYSVAYLGLGKSLFQLNRADDAVKILEKGIKIASKNGDLMPANEMQRLLVKLNS